MKACGSLELANSGHLEGLNFRKTAKKGHNRTYPSSVRGVFGRKRDRTCRSSPLDFGLTIEGARFRSEIESSTMASDDCWTMRASFWTNEMPDAKSSMQYLRVLVRFYVLMQAKPLRSPLKTMRETFPNGVMRGE